MKLIKPILIATLFIIVSCGSNNNFDKWPGLRLHSFPKEMQGDYKLNTGFFNQLLNGKKMDSILYLTIDANSIHEVNKTAELDNKLSDSLVLSKLGNYYVLSSKKKVNNGYWTLGYFKILKDGLHYMPYMGVDKLSDDNLSKYLNFMAKYKQNKISINTLPTAERETFYTFNGDTIKYYEMNDSKFLAYIEKEKPQMVIKFDKIITKKKK